MRKPIAYQIKNGTRPQGSELTEKDVGCTIGLLGEGFGKVLPIDVGKRVYLREYGTCMENNEQRDRRQYFLALQRKESLRMLLEECKQNIRKYGEGK